MGENYLLRLFFLRLLTFEDWVRLRDPGLRALRLFVVTDALGGPALLGLVVVVVVRALSMIPNGLCPSAGFSLCGMLSLSFCVAAARVV